MYKVKLKDHYMLVFVYFIGILIFGVLLILTTNFSENPNLLIPNQEKMGYLKYFSIVAIVFVIIGVIGIVYEIILIRKYAWLSKNGKLIKNIPYTTYVDAMYMKGGPRYDTTIYVDFKALSGETITLSRNLRGNHNFEKKYKTVDILIDEKNPKKRHYIDFNIEEI